MQVARKSRAVDRRFRVRMDESLQAPDVRHSPRRRTPRHGRVTQAPAERAQEYPELQAFVLDPQGRNHL